ncbi:IclR family transcriptional regulator [Actinomyces wuliandei]|uniref:IclR family transcriptional regulator n=1 Tax=Actinomyces wuliandei TaxID=2057743 RepID=UPI001FAAE220|nr:IclR family transcriptional regulator [Actinomyces wuliandei]
MSADGGGVREVKSAARTIDVLEYLAGRQGTQTRLRDVADALGAPRSSVYALLQTLVGRGWVAVDPTGTHYSIGIRTLLAGTSYLDRDPRVRLVRPVIMDAARRLGETVHLARLDGDQVVYLATAESHEYTRVLLRVGRRLPAVYTSLGKAIMAHNRTSAPEVLPPPLTAMSVRDPAVLAADLERTRQRGYAVDDQENIVGISCYGFALRYDVPVRDAISCSVPRSRLSQTHTEQILEVTEEARARIEGSAPAVPQA